jgi:hypothetical protein
MANDPGLANDTCIFMEAISGDGGAHNASDVWWLSPDIILTGPASGLDNADPGQVNPVQVRFHKKAADSNCNFPGDESITVQLWVANPSLAMAPNNSASTALVGFIGSPPPPDGGSATQQIDWDLPAGLPADDPQSPGHKCLIARCYPDSLTPNSDSFFVPGDQHVAQHNICVVPCNQALLHHNNQFTFKLATVNPDAHRKERAILRAVLDLRPRPFVRSTVLHRLQSVQGFQRLSSVPPPRGFKFDVSGLNPSDIHDNSPSNGPLNPLEPVPHPSFDAKVTLASPRVVHLNFIVDLTGTHAGGAFIFHLTQSGEDNRSQGGLTLVLVKL